MASEGGEADSGCGNSWGDIRTKVQTKLRTSRYLALCDAQGPAADELLQEGVAHPADEEERVKEGRRRLLSSPATAAEDPVTLDDLVRDGLTTAQQDKVLAQVFSYLQKTGRHLPRIPRRCGTAKVQKSAKGRLASTARRWLRSGVRSKIQSTEDDAEISEDELAQEIAQKLEAAQRRAMDRIRQQYQNCAEKCLKLPGRRKVTTGVLERAFTVIEARAQTFVGHVERRCDGQTPTPCRQRKSPFFPGAGPGSEGLLPPAHWQGVALECSEDVKREPRGGNPRASQKAVPARSLQKSATQQTSKIANKKVLPPEDTILQYSGRPSKSSYITSRCQQISGRTIGEALEMQFTDESGKQRNYRLPDLRYDLASGRLEIARGSALRSSGSHEQKDVTHDKGDGDVCSNAGDSICNDGASDVPAAPNTTDPCIPAKIPALTKPAEMNNTLAPGNFNAAGGCARKCKESPEQDDSVHDIGDGDDSDIEGSDSDVASERRELDEDDGFGDDEEPDTHEDADEGDNEPIERPTKRVRQCNEVDVDWRLALLDEYPENAWPPTRLKPGDEGFNAYAIQAQAKVIEFWRERGLRTDHELYQQTVEAVCHPSSPVCRVLCDARMGTGKTKIMLTILNQHFFDPRKKLPLLPKKELIKNLYDELLRWPSRYRTYFALVAPLQAARAVPLPQVANGVEPANADEVRRALEAVDQSNWNVPGDLADELRKAFMIALQMTNVRTMQGKRITAVNRGRLTTTYRRWFIENFPGKQQFMPGAPLRAMLLTAAGGSGSYLAMTEDRKRPKNPMAQFGYSAASMNPFDNSIVLIDEAHNLTRGSKAAQEAQATCRRLKTHLVTTQNTTLVCFTGTPVADNPKIKLANLEQFVASQRDDLMNLVKGRSPDVLPIIAGIAHAAGVSVVWADFLFQGLERRLTTVRTLEGFVTSYHGPLPGAAARVVNADPSDVVQEALDRKIDISALMAARYDTKHREKRGAPRDLQTYVNMDVASSHITREPFISRALADMDEYTPKLKWIANQITQSDRKAVVLIKKNTGYDLFRRILEDIRDRDDEDFEIADLSERSIFNCCETNSRGERIRVLCGEFDEAFEGTSFLNVRDLYIADVPLNATEFRQVMARVDRADGHRGLPPRERTVKIHLVCGALPEPLNGSAIAAYLWRETVKSQAMTSKKPEEWQQLMDRVQNVCEACETELCLDLSEDQALEELRDHVRNGEDDEFMCKVKQEKLGKIVTRLGALSSTRFDAARRNLCKHTVDETLLRELPGRCGYVTRAHKALKLAAMDRPMLCDQLE